MKIDDIKKKRPIVTKIFNISRVDAAIHPAYRLSFAGESLATNNGFIGVFELRDQSGNLPNFVGRWDHGDAVLDIDMTGENVGFMERLSFKRARGGYAGHHTMRIAADRRIFAIDIRIPDLQIYRGEIGFNINYEFNPGESLKVFDTLTRKKIISKLFSGLKW